MFAACVGISRWFQMVTRLQRMTIILYKKTDERNRRSVLVKAHRENVGAADYMNLKPYDKGK